MKFSPDCQWLGITGFTNNSIYLFSTNVSYTNNVKIVDIKKSIIVRSNCLHYPHGICFIDNNHIIVANREGLIDILKIQTEPKSNMEIKISPIATIKGGYRSRVKSPGSITCIKLENGSYRVLACNNYIHTITSHNVTFLKGVKVKNEGVLIRRGLSIPDGICVSPDRKWVAVSNHSTGTVLLYKVEPELNKKTKPSAMLNGSVCPHAIRFSEDGEMLLVADSASPYMHIYKRTSEDWCSVQKPYKSIRMLSEDVFLLGRYNTQDGGTKGIDINYADSMLAVTSEHLPLAFYDLDDVMEMASLQIDEEIKEKSLQRDHDGRVFNVRSAY